MRTQSISCVDEAGEASYLSGFVGVVLFKVWKVGANNEADVVKEPGKEGGLYCPYISINGTSKMSMRRTFQSRQPMNPESAEVVNLLF